MHKSLRIVFMGTPEFAVATLEALLKSRHKVVGVVTVPDKPANRGLKLQESAVKEFALKNNLPILQPEKLKNEEFVKALKDLNPDLQVVVAFRMLPEIVWSLPKYGTINLHASLLPQYRGAAPINWAIINGEKETGITTFFISHEIDTGDILMQKKIDITEEDDANTLHNKLMTEGAKLVVETVDLIADNITYALRQIVQNIVLNAAPKIFRENCKINFNKPVEEVYNFIRGLSPYPGAWTEIVDNEGKKTSLKIYKTVKHLDTYIPTGSIILNVQNQLFIGCKEGSIEIIELQAEGKKRMKTADFLRGFPIDKKNWKVVL